MSKSITIYDNLSRETFIHTAIEIISQSAYRGIQERGKFHIVLTCGETPRLIYKQLANLDTNWSLWEFYISDERFVQNADDDLNQVMIRNEFLNHVPVSESQIHFVKGGNDIKSTIISYSQSINNIPDFDLTILGIGEDGHVASLFPGNDIGLHPESSDVLPVYNSPKPPPQRVSISMKRLNKSVKIMIIASGERKRKIVDDFCNGAEIPALHIKGLEETILLYCTT
jgi:6-phosphogluconolactonase